MSLTWYVRIYGRIVGTVIAATEEEALKYADEKFPRWDFNPIIVERKTRKRKKR